MTVTFSLDFAIISWRSDDGLTGDTGESLVGARDEHEEEGVDGRAEDEVDEGVVGRGFDLEAGGVGAFRDRKGEMLDLEDLSDIFS